MNILPLLKWHYVLINASVFNHATLQEGQQKWEVMTCKNSIISIKKGYQETMYQNLSYDIYHARNGPISKETFNP